MPLEAPRLVHWLIEQGCNLHTTGHFGSALHCAVMGSRVCLFAGLNQHGWSVSEDDFEDDFRNSTRSPKKDEVVAMLIERGSDMKLTFPIAHGEFLTTFWVACLFNYTAILLDAGLVPETEDLQLLLRGPHSDLHNEIQSQSRE